VHGNRPRHIPRRGDGGGSGSTGPATGQSRASPSSFCRRPTPSARSASPSA
jgi:hypothetical protein